MAHASVYDIDLYYEIHGQGEPLLLLHGGLGNADFWSNQIPEFSRHYQVIAVDSRCHGRSTDSDEALSFSVMANDVVALLDHLSMESAHLVGWSDGGILGLEMAIHHPQRVRRIVAYGANYDPSGVRPDATENPEFLAYVSRAGEEYAKVASNPAGFNGLIGKIMTMYQSQPDYAAEDLARIDAPVLILDGDADEVIELEHTRTLAELIPTAELCLIPGTGHMAPWQKPAQFNRIVLDFLARE